MISKWDKRFMQITNDVAEWSSCLRRNVGAVLVKNNQIIATGYNGAPRGIVPCRDCQHCERENVASGTRAEYCKGVHAEQNVIIQAAKYGASIKGSTLYCTHKPCSICTKMLINCEISRIVYWNDYPDKLADKLLDESDIFVERLEI